MTKYEQIKDIPTLLYIIVFGIGFWGAILNFFKREERNIPMSNTQKIGIFLLDLISSMGLSVITFLSLLGLGFNELIAVAVSGWIAHQGTRAIYLVELVIADKLGSNSLKAEIKQDIKKDI